jgi:hypothetical protein
MTIILLISYNKLSNKIKLDQYKLKFKFDIVQI